MAAPHRGRGLLAQALATAITALLIAGGAAWGAGTPDDDATPAAAEPTEAPDSAQALQQTQERAAAAEADAAEAAEEVKPPKAPKAAQVPDSSGAARGHKAKPAKAAKAAKAAKGANSKGEALGHRKGAGHGTRVSAAARGETPPVGSCRNHGHWVSTVAKGLASCDDNPRPAPDAADD